MKHSQPNILWITLDSVRADHTSLHGYHRDTTLELSRIAGSADGDNFEHGIAHSTRTPVSVPSMLTGLYPSSHQMIGTQSGHTLPEIMKTAPELLAEQGYRTIAVSDNSYAGEAKGLDERFDEFCDGRTGFGDILNTYGGDRFKIPLPNLDSSRHDWVTMLKYIFKTGEYGPRLNLNRSINNDQHSFFITECAKHKLRDISEESDPFFCYVHYNDPHHAYIPPEAYRTEYTDEIDATADEAMAFARQMHEELYEWMAEGVPLSEEDWQMLYAMYDAIIRYVDACVGTLFDYVQDQFEDVIVVITADHGDLFGEYGLLGHHMVLHDGLIQVPLVTHGLEGVSHHTDCPTQHIDVMQTLLSLAGADTSQFQGYDLREQSREVAISQDLRGTVDDDETRSYDRIRQYNSDVDLSHLPKSLVTAVRTSEFKLVHTEEWNRLYQLPDEETDVKSEFPSVYEDLLSRLETWFETTGQPFEFTPEKPNLSEDIEQHLRDMGYLG